MQAEERKTVFWSIQEKAAADSAFRAALLADPKAAIGSEFDIAIPENVAIVVHENDAGTVHLPLPAKPEVLSEGSLRQVSGGLGEGCFGPGGCSKCF